MLSPHALEVQYSGLPEATSARDALLATRMGVNVERVVMVEDPETYARIVRARGKGTGLGMLLGGALAGWVAVLVLVVVGLAAGWPSAATWAIVLAAAIAYGMVVGSIAGHIGARETTGVLQRGLDSGHPVVRVSLRDSEGARHARNFLEHCPGASFSMSPA